MGVRSWILAIAVLGMMPSTAANAATLTVDDDGAECPTPDHTAVQDAVDAATPGDSIHICPGAYVEQVDVDKQLTIEGDGPDTVIRAPASLAAKFTTDDGDQRPIVYVHDADGVAVSGLLVDGDGVGNGNDGLTGIAYHEAGGTISEIAVEEIRSDPVSQTEAGVGILGLATGMAERSLSVDAVTVRDYQLAGIRLVGMSLGAGVADSTVDGSGSPDRLGRHGIEISDAAAATVSETSISGHACAEQSCGPDRTEDSLAAGLVVADDDTEAAVEGSTVAMNDVGLIVAGGLATLDGNAVLDNSATGVYAYDGTMDATANEIAGNGSGVTAVSFTLGQSSHTPSANITGNTIAGNEIGIGVAAEDVNAPPPAVEGAFNRIVENAGAGLDHSGPGEIDLENNWWGCSEGPDDAGCDSIAGTGLVDFDPWLVLSVEADPATIVAGGSSRVTPHLMTNSAAGSVGPNAFPDGTPIELATTLGAIAPSAPTLAGAAEASLDTTADDGGTASIEATLDAATAATEVTVLAAGRCANEQVGTDGPDELIGTIAGDLLRGLAGDDTLRGLAGDDCLDGGGGADVSFGGHGDDLLTGSGDGDELNGDAGNDELEGGGGDDDLNGGDGNDELGGGNGADDHRGGAGADVIRGGPGRDELTGASGRDELRGNRGADLLRGGPDRDRLLGGRGRDELRARDGVRDVVSCGRARDLAIVDRRDLVRANCESVRVR